MKNTRKGFTKIELIIVIVVCAVLVAAIIPSHIGLANAKKMQAELQQELDQLKQDMKDMIDDAIAGIKHPEATGGLTVEEIEQLIADAIAGIEFPENAGITADEVEELIADAIAGIESGVTEEQLKVAIVEAIKALEGKYLTKEQIIELIEKLLDEHHNGDDHNKKVVVDNLADFQAAVEDPTIPTITLDANIVLEESFTIDRDVEIDLNGYTIAPATGLRYPDAIVLNVEKDTEVAIKGGTLANRTSAIEPDMDFIRVRSGATLVLDNVDITITVTPEIYWNNTRDLWQMDPAEHHIFVLGSNSSLTLNNSNVYVVAPKVNNYPSYERNMSIVGVYFSTNASNSKFVMNGGSFTMLSTAPDATKKTDSLCFISSARDINAYPDATNTVSLNGEVEIIVGAPDNTGKLNSTNNLYYFGPGYYSGKTYYSGIKYVEMSADTIYNIDGYAHSLNTGYDVAWDLEDICQYFGTNKAAKEFYSSEEIKYHFTCTDAFVGCTCHVELTLGELAKLPTVKINGVTYHRCPECGKGGLVIGE